MICHNMDSYLSGKWEKESSSSVAFYADNGFGGMDKTFVAKVSTDGLRIEGGNFFQTK